MFEKRRIVIFQGDEHPPEIALILAVGGRRGFLDAVHDAEMEPVEVRGGHAVEIPQSHVENFIETVSPDLMVAPHLADHQRLPLPREFVAEDDRGLRDNCPG